MYKCESSPSEYMLRRLLILVCARPLLVFDNLSSCAFLLWSMARMLSMSYKVKELQLSDGWQCEQSFRHAHDYTV